MTESAALPGAAATEPRLRVTEIVIDCADHSVVVAFWSAALGRQPREVNEQYVALVPPASGGVAGGPARKERRMARLPSAARHRVRGGRGRLCEGDEQDDGDQDPHHARHGRGPRSDADLGDRDEDGDDRRRGETGGDRGGDVRW